MKSKSSVLLGIAVSQELRELLRQHAAKVGVGESFLVRKCIIDYLAASGEDVSRLSNPAGRGERTDLRAKVFQVAETRMKQNRKNA